MDTSMKILQEIFELIQISMQSIILKFFTEKIN